MLSVFISISSSFDSKFSKCVNNEFLVIKKFFRLDNSSKINILSDSFGLTQFNATFNNLNV